MKLGLVCHGEPGLAACCQLAAGLQALGVTVTLFTPELPAPALAGNIWAVPLPPMQAACSDLLAGLDAVGVFLDGATAAAFRQAHISAARLRNQEPVPLFSGPIRPLYGDALAADLLPRLGYNLICLQGEAQQEELTWLLKGSGHHQQQHALIGLWWLPSQPIGANTLAQRLLLVLDQASIPPSPFANGVLYQRLSTIARDNPHWQVRLQADSPPCPATPETSLAWHHQQAGHAPANLQLGEADDLPLALMQATACLGIASDWLLTSMVWGKPTAVLGDYGIRTDFNGPLFFGSGAMHQLADCLPLERLLQLPRPNSQWLAARGWAIADGPQRLLQRLRELPR